MKAGERPPKGAKELVLRLAAAKPRSTNKEIREALQRKFGESIVLSDRTISRYCQDAGLPTSSRDSAQPTEVSKHRIESGPLSVELIVDRLKKHWDDLAGVAGQLSSTFDRIVETGYFPGERFSLVELGLELGVKEPDYRLSSYLLSHLKAEFAEFRDLKDLLAITGGQGPLIEILAKVARRRYFGRTTCEICRSWGQLGGVHNETGAIQR